jgi:His/Glu/Gln/Arg/opine family amino acid ABC transporter permease subunit
MKGGAEMPDWAISLKQQFIQAFIEGNRWKYMTNGVVITIEVTILALIIGIILGIIVAVIRSSYDQQGKKLKGATKGIFKVLNFICNIYLTVIRGTPLMVQILIMFFVIFASSNNTFLVAVLTFGINSGAYVAEIFRSGIMSIDPGQTEASRSLGFGYVSTMIYVIVPQAIKNVLPALVNEFITLLKDTSIVTVIGLKDLTKGAMIIQGITYQAFIPLIAAALIYLVLVVILTKVLGNVERRLRRNER